MVIIAVLMTPLSRIAIPSSTSMKSGLVPSNVSSWLMQQRPSMFSRICIALPVLFCFMLSHYHPNNHSLLIDGCCYSLIPVFRQMYLLTMVATVNMLSASSFLMQPRASNSLVVCAAIPMLLRFMLWHYHRNNQRLVINWRYDSLIPDLRQSN